MNPKIDKLKAERCKNSDKIAALQERNRKLDEQIMKLENTDIIGMVREIGMTPEQLSTLLRDRQTIAPKPEDMKETEEYEE